MNERGTLRLFTALELPPEWQRELSEVQSELERNAAGELKLVRPDLLHVTLVFLGNQPASMQSSIEDACSAAAVGGSPFRLSLSSVGSFGSPHTLRVIWLGLAGPPVGLQALHGALTASLAAHRVPFDQKPLVPHITIARAKRAMERSVSLRLHGAVTAMKPRRALSMDVREFVLMESRLGPSGPSYTPLGRFPLVGRSADEGE